MVVQGPIDIFISMYVAYKEKGPIGRVEKRGVAIIEIHRI